MNRERNFPSERKGIDRKGSDNEYFHPQEEKEMKEESLRPHCQEEFKGKEETSRRKDMVVGRIFRKMVNKFPITEMVSRMEKKCLIWLNSIC